jgi:hypothetical protein
MNPPLFGPPAVEGRPFRTTGLATAHLMLSVLSGAPPLLLTLRYRDAEPAAGQHGGEAWAIRYHSSPLRYRFCGLVQILALEFDETWRQEELGQRSGRRHKVGPKDLEPGKG